MESIIIYYDLFLSKYLMNTVRQISGSSLLINTDRFSKKNYWKIYQQQLQ